MATAAAFDRAVLEALALMPPDTVIQVSLRAGDLVHVLEERHTAAAPQSLTTQQAASLFGYAADRWKRWARGGRIAGAWQDARGGSWHLPRASCEAHIRQLQGRGGTSALTPSAHRSPAHRRPRGPRNHRASSPAARAGDVIAIEEARATPARTP
jgi:hypothetical protein